MKIIAPSTGRRNGVVKNSKQSAVAFHLFTKAIMALKIVNI